MAETEEATIPGLETIPILPPDYPLFDWADWPQSRAALQSGVSTSRFQKDAWNAIVYALDNALKTAGADPQLLYSLEDSLIPISYGRLKASAFNGVRHHIDQFTPLPWPWAVDPSSRGYIGTKWFRGTTIEYDETGAISKIKQGDEVYPEYILELARRVNLLLELMRGTADTAESTALHAAQSQIQSSGAVSGAGVHMDRAYTAQTKVGSITLEDFTGAGFRAIHAADSLVSTAMERTPAAGISRRLPFYSKVALSGRSARNEYVLRTSAAWLAASSVQAAVSFIYPNYTRADELSKSLSAASAVRPLSLPVSGQQISSSAAAVAMEARNELKTTTAQQQSATDLQIGAMSIRPRFVVAAPKSRTLQQLEILLTKMIEVLMHSDFEPLLWGMAREEPVQGILMRWGIEPFQVTGSGKRAAPSALLLHMDPWLWSRGNAISGMFDPWRAYLFDTGIWTANRALEQPRVSGMWALNDLLLTVRSQTEPPAAQLLWAVRSDVFDAFGRAEVPEDLRLQVVTYRQGSAAGRLQTPEELRMFTPVWIAGIGQPRQDAPRDMVGYTLTLIAETGRPRQDIPRDLIGRAFTLMDGKSQTQQDTPREVLLWVTPSSVDGDGRPRIEIPEESHLYGPVIILKKASSRQDAPREVLLWGARCSVDGDGRPRRDAPREVLSWALLTTRSMADAQRETPLDQLMKVIVGFTNTIAPALQMPSRFMLSSITGMVNMVYPLLQVPQSWLLRDSESIISVTGAELAQPWAYQGSTVFNTALDHSPELQEPMGIQCHAIEQLTAAARTALILRRAARGMVETICQAVLEAELTAATAVRMTAAAQLMTVAHAGLLIRNAVHTAGSLTESIGGFVTAELMEAEDILMATAAGLYTQAGSAIAWVRNNGGGRILQKIDVDGGGFRAGTIATRGGIVIDTPEVFGTADKAATVPTAGRTIELEITVRLGGISARYANVRMLSEIPAPEVFGTADSESVRTILGEASIEDIAGFGQGRLAATGASRGGTEFNLVSVGGGSVQGADGLWADPVQSGSDLHITHVQQSWNDSDELYIDMDVFYEPVQMRSDLYIRSADFMWTDGDNANIDTEFFLAPVQEGSDLYIRQDIFGGE